MGLVDVKGGKIVILRIPHGRGERNKKLALWETFKVASGVNADVASTSLGHNYIGMETQLFIL